MKWPVFLNYNFQKWNNYTKRLIGTVSRSTIDLERKGNLLTDKQDKKYIFIHWYLLEAPATSTLMLLLSLLRLMVLMPSPVSLVWMFWNMKLNQIYPLALKAIAPFIILTLKNRCTCLQRRLSKVKMRLPVKLVFHTWRPNDTLVISTRHRMTGARKRRKKWVLMYGAASTSRDTTQYWPPEKPGPRAWRQ